MKKYVYLAQVESKAFPIGSVKFVEASSDAEALGGVLDFVSDPGCNCLLGVIVWDLDKNICICIVKV